MDLFLKKVHINKIFHLENIDIEIDSENKKHLMLTGKNGSGKTSLLNALADFLQHIQNDKTLNFLGFKKNIDFWQQELIRRIQTPVDGRSILEAEKMLQNYQQQEGTVYAEISPEFSEIVEI